MWRTSGIVLALFMPFQSPNPCHPNWMVLLDRRVESHWSVDDMSLVNLAHVTQSLSGCHLVSVFVTKACGSPIPWLNVEVTIAPPRIDDHLALEDPMILILPTSTLSVKKCRGGPCRQTTARLGKLDNGCDTT